MIVVLGDLGRSPRMLGHALSAAELAHVDLVGYVGAELPRSVADHPRIRVHRLAAPASLAPGRGFRSWLDLATRLLRQTLELGRLLRRLPRPDLVLVQNPPALPTLAVSWLVARTRRARWVIDWHNLGFTVLALKLGAEAPAVRLARRCETWLGRRADAHLCVSDALREALLERWRIGPAKVVYDLPSRRFAPLSVEEAEGELERLLPQLGVSPATARGPTATGAGDGGVHVAAADRAPGADRGPVVIVSPSSWTPDEDYELLLESLDHCQRAIARTRAGGSSVPQLLVLLTGRGPLRAEYEERLRVAAWPDIRVVTGWISPQDYPRLLAAADLGLSLHRSSSGLDLPMKIADMVGSGLPVCALDYGPVLAEQLGEGGVGALFTGAEELAALLVELTRDFPSGASRLEALHRAARERPVERWEESWRREAGPLLVDLLRAGRR